MIVEGVEGVAYNEIVEIETPSGDNRRGQVLEVKGDLAVIQVFEVQATLIHQLLKSVHRWYSKTWCCTDI